MLAIAACTDAPTAVAPQPTSLTPSLRLSNGWPHEVVFGCVFRSSDPTFCGFTPTFETPIYIDSLVGDWRMSGVVTHPYGYYARNDTLDLDTPIPIAPIRISFQPAATVVKVSAAPAGYSCLVYKCINGSAGFGPWVLVIHEANGADSSITLDNWRCGVLGCGSGTTIQSDVGVTALEVIPTGTTLTSHIGFEFVGGLRPPSDSILLTCPAQVQRGSTATCTAAAEPPSAQLTDLEWHFVPDDSTLGSDIRPADGTEITTTWAGPMVASGTVRLQAKVDGTAHEATAHIAVTPRDWSADTVKWTWADSSPGDLPPNPHKFDGQLGGTRFNATGDGSVIAFVTEGPNTGLNYFTGPPGKVTITSFVNIVALARGSAFWRAQIPMRNPNVIGGVKQCTRADVERIVPLVRMHEGTAKREHGSHVDTFLREFTRLSRVQGEGLVHAGDFALQKILDSWYDAAYAFSRQTTDSTEENPLNGRLDCVFNYKY